MRFAVSTTTRISGASEVSTPLSAISAIRSSEVSSSFADPVVGVLEIARGEVDALGELAELGDNRVAMAEIGRRGPGDAVDLLAYGRDALVHARDDAADLLCAFTGALGAE